MSEALDILRAATIADVTCKSGIIYTIHPPRFEDCIAAVGDVPMPVLEELAKREQEGDTEPKRATLEQLTAIAALNDAYVLLAIQAVNGIPVAEGELAARDIPGEDYDDLKGYAKREIPLPGKG